MNNTIQVNGLRLWESIMEIAQIGPGEKGGSRRLALTDDDKDGRDLFIKWCKEAGCAITIDDMGNIFARRPGKNNDLAPVCSGSHLDTQPHGGKFDGIYGVLAALEVVRTLNDNNIETEAPLEVINWTNEEGSRFAPAMVSSGVFAGLFEKQFAYSRTDSEGNSLKAELERTGYLGDEICGDHPMRALFEAHIEQGPILENSGDQIGVVIGGQGQKWFDVRVKGQDSHAGSTPMNGRRDALVASAVLIQEIQAIAFKYAPYGVGTVGEMEVLPNSRNTIPGEIFLTVDIRNPDQDNLNLMGEDLSRIIEMVREKHHVTIECDEIWDKPPVTFNPECIAAVTAGANQLGYKYREIVSGAGHDACQVCEIVPTSMIFVPCEGGLSHNEEENATPEDLEAGCNVLLRAMVAVAG
jgi:N-carbamoyl-L-amino-acid hydrolase